MEIDDTGKPWTSIDCMYFAIVTCASVGSAAVRESRKYAVREHENTLHASLDE
jgi:hypothetical protein